MIKQFSTISADELSALKKRGITESDLKNSLPFLTSEKIAINYPVCKINVMFYIDRFGNFMNNKTKTAKIVSAIYNSLEKKDKQEVSRYLLDYEMENSSDE